MKILFVFSGNFKAFPISPFTKAQAESLRDRGIEVDYFPITGKGPRNYLKNVGPLRAHLKNNRYDIIHAHYSLCGWVAVLASLGRIPVVVSLMGDDAQGTFTGNNRVDFKSRYLIFLTRLIQPFVQAVISKSANLEKAVWRKKISHIVPNGVRLDQFKIHGRASREVLGLHDSKKYVLFLGSPTDTNKNFTLVQSAAQLLNNAEVELLNPYPVAPEQVVHYLNAADVFTLCSYGEGSPNVVKEAMACNCPMVVTPAGDAAWVVGQEPGCYVASYDPADFADKLTQALRFAAEQGRTKGRERIHALGLDAEAVAEKIESIYHDVLGLEKQELKQNLVKQ